jgi:site-specific DNA-methyltransferase (adenine-specific)
MAFCKLLCGDVIDSTKTLEPDSVDLIVTSPPYGVGMDYEVDVSREEYIKLVNDSCKEFKRVLKSDGRAVINVPFTMNYNNALSLVMHEWMTAFLGTGLNIRDIIIWNQSNSGNDTAWGSWKSASSPWLRHQCEGIIVGFKDQWKKIRKGESDITRDEFMKYVVDLWTMPCARNADHPAVFSEELPYRAIKLFSYIGDTVLDPFVGSGTTMKVACRLRRNVVGIDKERKYCDLIRKSNWFYQSSLSNDIEYIYEEL